MNRKMIFGGLLGLMLSNATSYSMQAHLMQYAINTTMASALLYGTTKISAKDKERTFFDAPEAIQVWARKHMAEKGVKNADSIPLKVGEGWAVHGGSFITVDKNEVEELENCMSKEDSESPKKRILAETTLFHEIKHFQNGDCGKGCLAAGMGFAAYAQRIPILGVVAIKGMNYATSFSIPGLLVKSGLWLGANLAYIRYQEKEAERFAYMNLSSLEKLEIIKANNERNAELFESNLLKYPFRNTDNWLGQKIRPILSDKWKSLYQEKQNCDDPMRLSKIEQQQKRLVKVAGFIFDHQHPDFRSTVALAQECIDKRKADEEERSAEDEDLKEVQEASFDEKCFLGGYYE